MGSVRALLNSLGRRSSLGDTVPGQWAHSVYEWWVVRDWHRRGEPVPPPSAIKRKTLLENAQQFGLRTLVETGTRYGDTPFTLWRSFDQIVSIELDHALHEQAKERLRKHSHITLLEGDSGDLIPAVLANIAEPALFWLDAHYSGGVTARGDLDSPVSKELDAIFDHHVTGHVILIDDAKDFTGQGGYPELSALRTSVLARRPDYTFDLRHNIIRIYKGGPRV